MMSSLFDDLGLSLTVREPIVAGAGSVRRLKDEIGSYSQTISAWGGFDSATIGLTLTENQIEEWIENGIGRDIQVYNSAGASVWEGYVDSINANLAGKAVSVESLMSIGNRVAAVYSRLMTAFNPPVRGEETTTTLANDTLSQGRYGIWEKTVSAGTCIDADAQAARDTFLAERAYPIAVGTDDIGGSSVGLTLNCKGYFYWLTAFPFNQTVLSSTLSVSARILAILAASPNAVLSTNYSLIDTNALLIPQYEGEKSYADAQIKSLVGLGNASGNRYTFGVYAGRQVIYTQAPTAPTYQMSMQQGTRDVFTYNGNAIVRPWDVRPANWIFTGDFMIGRVPAASNFRRDQRMRFIESVTYTAPYGLNINGGKIETLSQLLSQLSMGGMTA